MTKPVGRDPDPWSVKRIHLMRELDNEPRRFVPLFELSATDDWSQTLVLCRLEGCKWFASGEDQGVVMELWKRHIKERHAR